jgi:surfactin synthase thioesterase subunit
VRSTSREPARLRLFCFPYAGAGASIFHGWAEELPAGIEVCAIQLPGRENRIAETPFSSVSALIPPLVDAVRPLLDLPVAVFGHSMGALLGFEFGRALRRTLRLQPVHLFVSAHRAPQRTRVYRRRSQLGETEFLDELRRLNGTRPGVLEHEELRDLVVSLMRADLAVCDTYHYAHEAPLDCAISAFGGLADREVDRAALAPWRAQTSDRFELRMLPGDHFFIRESPAALLEAISSDVRRQLDAGASATASRSGAGSRTAPAAPEGASR